MVVIDQHAAHERLDGVVFECLGWAELVQRYDGPETLFYLDPPYFGGESDYRKGIFDRSQFARGLSLARVHPPQVVAPRADQPPFLGLVRGPQLLVGNRVDALPGLDAVGLTPPVRDEVSIEEAGHLA